LGRSIGRPALEIAFRYVRWHYGLDLRQAAPMDAVVSTHTPVLLLHGSQDDSIPPRHARMIRDANPVVVRLWEMAEADHTNVATVDAAKFQQEVFGFFAQSKR
jgi:pimeloyl-ACP methyl ester carboxylesterase